MSHVREPVEWVFKEVTKTFAFLDFAQNQKILLSPCGIFYMVAILLCNAHTILHYPQVPQYFNCPPPTLDEYFTGGPIDDNDLDRWAMESAWGDVDVPEHIDEDNELWYDGPQDVPGAE
jgi:hypothetical protein